MPEQWESEQCDAEQLGFDYSPSVHNEPVEVAVAPRSFTVDVIRSPKRRKTAQARLVGDRLEVRIPGRSTRKHEQELVAYFVDKFTRATDRSEFDLAKRSTELAERYGLSEPASIRWVSNQKGRWGSCTPVDKTIRLSDRLARFPTWVIDYVIVHELAHLDVVGHGPDFWRLVNQYPKTERARGFLIAQSWQAD